MLKAFTPATDFKCNDKFINNEFSYYLKLRVHFSKMCKKGFTLRIDFSSNTKSIKKLF